MAMDLGWTVRPQWEIGTTWRFPFAGCEADGQRLRWREVDVVVTGCADIDECLVRLGLLVSEQPGEFDGICCEKLPEFFLSRTFRCPDASSVATGDMTAASGSFGHFS
jgi:hypothetical protein